MIIEFVSENDTPLREVTGTAVPEIGDEVVLQTAAHQSAVFFVMRKRFFCEEGLAETSSLNRVRIFVRSQG